MAYIVVLPALMLPAVFQIVEIIPQLGAALALPIPPAVTAALDKIKPNRPKVLNYLALGEPLYLLYLILVIYWNNVASIIPYFLWLCVRYEYSPYTKFALEFIDSHVSNVLAGQDKIKPYFDLAKEKLSIIGKNLPK